mmetsp:Transcript_4270/g.12305  ORF Transcript_4270/g.12305 Transcript_4270/m.12305 type:complete len:229 (+) Transcript_4270:962-1648(+)
MVPQLAEEVAESQSVRQGPQCEQPPKWGPEPWRDLLSERDAGLNEQPRGLEIAIAKRSAVESVEPIRICKPRMACGQQYLHCSVSPMSSSCVQGRQAKEVGPHVSAQLESTTNHPWAVFSASQQQSTSVHILCVDVSPIVHQQLQRGRMPPCRRNMHRLRAQHPVVQRIESAVPATHKSCPIDQCLHDLSVPQDGRKCQRPSAIHTRGRRSKLELVHKAGKDINIFRC